MLITLEGDGKLGGSVSIVYNEAVLQNVRNAPNFLRYGPVPGSWSDAEKEAWAKAAKDLEAACK